MSAATIIDRVLNFWSGCKKGRKIADFGRKWTYGIGSGPYALTKLFWEYPPWGSGDGSGKRNSSRSGNCILSQEKLTSLLAQIP